MAGLSMERGVRVERVWGETGRGTTLGVQDTLLLGALVISVSVHTLFRPPCSTKVDRTLLPLRPLCLTCTGGCSTTAMFRGCSGRTDCRL